MATKVGINGFGRTARQVLKAINQYHKDKLEVAAINGPSGAKIYAHLLKWDSTYGRYLGEVLAAEDSIIVDGKAVKVFAGLKPEEARWGDYGVELVVEASGQYTDATKAAGHLKGGPKKVIITAPASGEDVTLVLGVNEDRYDPARHHVISNASCTTNCIAPVVKVLHSNFGVSKGLMSTVHAYTMEQRLLDRAHRDFRRARAAAVNIVPTTTGAAKAVTEVIPELKGRIHGLALRVPTPTVSIVDFVADLEREVTVKQVNNAFRQAAGGPLKGILEFCEEELVSIDFKGNPASAIVDAPLTMVIGGNMVKVLAWYDNEWGYSCRVADLAAYITDRGL